MMKNRKTDKEHVLENIWLLMEKDTVTYSGLLDRLKEMDSVPVLKSLEKESFILVEDDRVKLTEKGYEYSQGIVRRHRLAEVLLTEILEIEDRIVSSQACEFEHILTPEVTDSICTFLGHPHKCPHGLPIPRGECCKTFNKKIGPLVKPLSEMKIGDIAKIVFMSPKTHMRLDKLMTFGITPGAVIRLHQKKPSFVLQIAETDLAIDPEIGENIYVKPVNESN
ncbi:metal-dependent transcriptional regulator [candidate division KSB1 bacterium]